MPRIVTSLCLVLVIGWIVGPMTAAAAFNTHLRYVQEDFVFREDAPLQSSTGEDITIDGTLSGYEAILTYRSPNKLRKALIRYQSLDGTMKYDGFLTCDGINCGQPVNLDKNNKRREIEVLYQPSFKLENDKAPRRLRLDLGVEYWYWENTRTGLGPNERNVRHWTYFVGGFHYRSPKQHGVYSYRVGGRAGYALAGETTLYLSRFSQYKSNATFNDASMKLKLQTSFTWHTILPITVRLEGEYISNQQDSTRVTLSDGSSERWIEPENTIKTLTGSVGVRF